MKKKKIIPIKQSFELNTVIVKKPKKIPKVVLKPKKVVNPSNKNPRYSQEFINHCYGIFKSFGLVAFKPAEYHLGIVNENEERFDWYLNKGALLYFPDGDYGCKKIGNILEVEDVADYISSFNKRDIRTTKSVEITSLF